MMSRMSLLYPTNISVTKHNVKRVSETNVTYRLAEFMQTRALCPRLS